MFDRAELVSRSWELHGLDNNEKPADFRIITTNPVVDNHETLASLVCRPNAQPVLFTAGPALALFQTGGASLRDYVKSCRFSRENIAISQIEHYNSSGKLRLTLEPMQNFSFPCFLLLLLGLVTQALGQDSFKLGTQTVVIPPPTGFVNAYPRIPAIKAHFDAISEKDWTTLAVHIPSSLAPRIERGEVIGSLGYYTRVDLPNSMTTLMVTPQMFADFVSRTDRTIGVEFDPKGKTVTTAVANMRRIIKDSTGQSVDVGTQQPVYLGHFDRRADIYSIIALMTLRVGDRTIPMVGSTSWIVVNERIVYVNVYKEMVDDNDVSVVLDFTKKWTASIIAANK